MPPAPPREGGILRFAGLTVGVAILMALVGLFGIYQAIDDLVGAPTPYSAETVALEGARLDLVGARGDELTFYIADTSPKGYWATPAGLRLELRNRSTGFETSVQVMPPKEKDWEDPVFISRFTRTRPDFEARGSFTVPDFPGPETQTLTGRLEGEFLYPGMIEDEMHFSTASRNLQVPAKVEVVSAEESERISSHFRDVRWRRILLGVLYAIVAFGYPLSYGMWRNGEQKRRWEPYLTLAAGLAVWACFAALWLWPFGA